MNDLERRSFYSFLGLYIVSSFILITLVGYLYYRTQIQSMETQLHYRMEHVVDKEASKVIAAHMNGYMFSYVPPAEDMAVTMVDRNGTVVFGEERKELAAYKPGYYQREGEQILVSDATRGHLGIDRIIVTSQSLSESIASLQKYMIQIVLWVMLAVGIIAWILSRIFIKPIRQRVAQIETFVNDVTHELNTPITSLSMATEQALGKGECSAKTLKNISISTKQLYDIYRSLTYLNFSGSDAALEAVDISTVLGKSIDYYRPLSEIKRITLKVEIESCMYLIPETEASLLFGNLIGNAIKYSPAGSTVQLAVKACYFLIRDEGIGIEQEKQKEIFERFSRGTKQSGGFGIGLSVVKSICDRYGIGLALNSAPDKGTEFKLSFINQK